MFLKIICAIKKTKPPKYYILKLEPKQTWKHKKHKYNLKN